MAPRRPLEIKLSTLAVSQLESIHSYIAERNASAATKVLGAIRSSFERLARSPYIGRTGTIAGTREFSLARYRYLIIYRVLIDQNRLEIAGVFHTALGARKV